MHARRLNLGWKYVSGLLIVMMGMFGLAPQVHADFAPSQLLPAAAVAQSAEASTVQQFLETKMVQERLASLGYSQDEVQKRLARLSDVERHQLAQSIDQLQAGGDSGLGFVVGVLLVVILVIVILKLMDKEIIIH